MESESCSPSLGGYQMQNLSFFCEAKPILISPEDQPGYPDSLKKKKRQESKLKMEAMKRPMGPVQTREVQGVGVS